MEEATNAIVRNISVNPGDPMAFNVLAGIFYQQGRFDEAVEAYRKAVEIEPNNAVIVNNLGLALQAQRKDAEALENFDTAKSLNPAIPKLDMLRAEVLQDLRRPEEAADLVEKALAADFRQPPVFAVRGDADQFEPVALGGDDAQRAFADGAGGAEEDDASFGQSVFHCRRGFMPR